MPLMGSIYVGNSALQTSQNALNTTAHNMSNSDTTGYVRQQVLLGTSTYNTLSINAAGVAKQQVGLGVTYSATRQVRDYFLDQTYRRESGRSAFYEVSSSAISEVENILGELDGVAFKGSLDDLWTSVQELAKSPESSVVQGLFVQRASNFISRAQSVYQGLSDYQDNLNLQVIQMVDKINTYGNQIKVLNDQIKKIECGGVEYANDLRDARNQIIDELSAMGNIKVTEEYDGALSISFEGTPFVSNDVVYEMNTHIDATTGFVTPFWTQNASFTYNEDGTRNYNISNAKVFNTNQTISTDLNTDIGQLKALVLARGDRRGTYEDLEDKDYYNENIAQSVIVNIQGEFDRLINSVVESINKVLEEASDKTPGGYLSNEDGSALQLFVKKNGEDSKFTIMNISVNQDLIEQPTKLGFVKEDGSVDYETAEKLKAAFEAEEYTLNPNVIKKSNFMDFYSDLVSQVGNSGAVYRSIVDNQQQMVLATDNSRQQVIGVSTDEELSNMIRFQNGYNAASRYINAISEMLEHLITRLT